MWEVNKQGDDFELLCHIVPTCQFCGTPVEVWMLKKLNFDIIKGSGKRDGHAIDVDTWCPVCGLEETFGVAVSEKEYKAISGLIEITHVT